MFGPGGLAALVRAGKDGRTTVWHSRLARLRSRPRGGCMFKAVVALADDSMAAVRRPTRPAGQGSDR